ncbi:MAG: hypothetical protein IPK80_07940 [Nannocystis sp.]|nr:hypothetical protein [Nannocystis sp.]
MIECKAPFGHAAEPWKTWGVLAKIETAAGDAAAAGSARARARDAFLAYRRASGENHSRAGRLSRQSWRGTPPSFHSALWRPSTSAS